MHRLRTSIKTRLPGQRCRGDRDDHAMVEKCRVNNQDRRFLPAGLSRGSGKHAPDFSPSDPAFQTLPGTSKNCRICLHMLPNRAGVLKITASAPARSCNVQKCTRERLFLWFWISHFPEVHPGEVSGCGDRITSVADTSRAPSATASDRGFTWQNIE